MMKLVACLLLVGTVGLSSAYPMEEGEEAVPILPYISCRYWCNYEGEAYCCDDGSLSMPADHDTHENLQCPPMDQHICKKNPSTGTSTIYLNSTLENVVLAKGDIDFKELLCASDGYCGPKDKCCPTPCVKRHLCLKGLLQKTVKEQQQEEEVVVDPVEE